ncbi:uncharacterized protein V1518DRAFT_421593 [Limtongia smithiae]|uniref:uncharacterized protein n=1 Tax=Limtongia smithiae TaxID=1125753 RepID=UPI0034CF3BF9
MPHLVHAHCRRAVATRRAYARLCLCVLLRETRAPASSLRTLATDALVAAKSEAGSDPSATSGGGGGTTPFSNLPLQQAQQKQQENETMPPLPAPAPYTTTSLANYRWRLLKELFPDGMPSSLSDSDSNTTASSTRHRRRNHQQHLSQPTPLNKPILAPPHHPRTTPTVRDVSRRLRAERTANLMPGLTTAQIDVLDRARNAATPTEWMLSTAAAAAKADAAQQQRTVLEETAEWPLLNGARPSTKNVRGVEYSMAPAIAHDSEDGNATPWYMNKRAVRNEYRSDADTPAGTMPQSPGYNQPWYTSEDFREWLISRPLERKDPEYRPASDPTTQTYQRFAIHFWPPFNSIEESLLFRQYLSRFGVIVQYINSLHYDRKAFSNGFLTVAFHDPGDMIYHQLVREFGFRCVPVSGKVQVLSSYAERVKLMNRIGLDPEKPKMFLVLRSPVSIDESGLRLMLNEARIGVDEEPLTYRQQLLEQYTERLMSGFEGFQRQG